METWTLVYNVFLREHIKWVIVFHTIRHLSTTMRIGFPFQTRRLPPVLNSMTGTLCPTSSHWWPGCKSRARCITSLDPPKTDQVISEYGGPRFKILKLNCEITSRHLSVPIQPRDVTHVLMNDGPACSEQQKSSSCEDQQKCTRWRILPTWYPH